MLKPLPPPLTTQTETVSVPLASIPSHARASACSRASRRPFAWQSPSPRARPRRPSCPFAMPQRRESRRLSSPYPPRSPLLPPPPLSPACAAAPTPAGRARRARGGRWQGRSPRGPSPLSHTAVSLTASAGAPRQPAPAPAPTTRRPLPPSHHPPFQPFQPLPFKNAASVRQVFAVLLALAGVARVIIECQRILSVLR